MWAERCLPILSFIELIIAPQNRALARDSNEGASLFGFSTNGERESVLKKWARAAEWPSFLTVEDRNRG